MSVTFNLVITMERVKIWLMNTSVTVRMDLTAKAAQIVSKIWCPLIEHKTCYYTLKTNRTTTCKKEPFLGRIEPYRPQIEAYSTGILPFYLKKTNPKTYHADSVQWKFMQGGSQRRPKKRKWYFAKSVHFSYTAWLITTAQW